MKKLVYIFMIVMVCLASYNCEDAPSLTTPPEGNYATFETTEITVPVELDGTGSAVIKVYTTATMGNARSINLIIDGSSTASTTSYSIPSTVDIPANSNEGTFTISLTDTDISNGGETLLLRLGQTEEILVGADLKINILRNCPSDLAGNYVYTTGNERAVTITSTGDKTYTISADDGFDSEYPFYISEVCNEITVMGGFIADNFGIAVSGSGSVDSSTGNITIRYTVDGYFDNREMILSKQ